MSVDLLKTPPFISLESPDQPEVIALIEELDAYQAPLYPAESHHGINIEALSSKNVLFAVDTQFNREYFLSSTIDSARDGRVKGN